MLTAKNADRALKAQIARSDNLDLSAAAAGDIPIFCDPNRAYDIRSIHILTVVATDATTMGARKIDVGVFGDDDKFSGAGFTPDVSKAAGVQTAQTLTTTRLAKGETLTVTQTGAASANPGEVQVVVELTPVEETTSQGSLVLAA